MSAELRRKLFFWMLVMTFFIITPTIIAYSFGYRYSNERGIFIYSGSITIKAIPTRVSIEINGKPTPSKRMNFLNNSYHIGSLRPGTYNLTVKAPGYTSWTKDVSVHSGISTEFWNVMLANESPEVENYNTTHIQKIFPAPEAHLYAYTTAHDGLFSIYTLDTDTKESRQLFSSSDHTFTQAMHRNIEWSPESDLIVVPISPVNEEVSIPGSPTVSPDEKELAPQEQFAIIDIRTQEVLFLHELYPARDINHVRWSPKEKETLYFLSDGDLVRIPINDLDKAIILKSNIASYDFSEDLLLTVHNDTGIIFSHKINNFDSFDQITTTSIDTASECGTLCRLIAYDNKRVALINANSDLFLYNVGEEATYPLQKLGTNIKSVQFSDDGKKLLYWSDHELHVHFLRKWETQPYRNENETIHIARFFQPLSQVQWSKDYEHVLFALDGKLQLIEIDYRDKNNVQTLYTLMSPETEMFADFRDNILFFIQKPEDACCSDLYSFEFPEQTGIFGL